MRRWAFVHPREKGAKKLEHNSGSGDCSDTPVDEMKANEAEELLARRLAEGTPDDEAAEVEAVKRLAPRWEIRIQAERDPIVEETKAYRAIATEIDDRYDDKDKGQTR
jgi:hypothetical protein